MAPIDLISILVSDELRCRSQRLLERRHKQARFRDANKTLDNFDFQFNPKMNRALVFDWRPPPSSADARTDFLSAHQEAGKSHLAQAIGHAVILQGYRVLYREAHALLEDLADATLDGKRKEHMELLSTVPLLIIDDLGMRKLPLTAAEELLEIIMRRYERASTLLTSNRPVEDWGKLLGDSAAVTAMLDRLLHHGHVLKCGPRSWRTKSEQPRRSPMTKAKTIRRPGKSSPATSRSVIQGPLQRSFTKRIGTTNTKPFAESAITAHSAKGHNRRFLRSQPRVLRPWMSPPGATLAGTTLT